LVGLDEVAPLSVTRSRSPAAARCVDRGCRRRVDPALRISLAQRRAQVVVEAAQEQRRSVDLGDVRPEPMEDARELDGDVSAAADHDPLGRRSRWKASFEVMACSMPGIGGLAGHPRRRRARVGGVAFTVDDHVVRVVEHGVLSKMRAPELSSSRA